jgi:plasmid maintenance system antidote protein VapI
MIRNYHLTPAPSRFLIRDVKSGAEQLKDWMHRRRFMQKEAAEHLGFDVTYVSHLVAGRRVPGLDNALVIERETGIPVEAWASIALDTRVNDDATVGANPQDDKA